MHSRSFRFSCSLRVLRHVITCSWLVQDPRPERRSSSLSLLPFLFSGWFGRKFSVGCSRQMKVHQGLDRGWIIGFTAGAAAIDRLNMNYWTLAAGTPSSPKRSREPVERTSPADLATFASRTITWSALEPIEHGRGPLGRVSYCSRQLIFLVDIGWVRTCFKRLCGSFRATGVFFRRWIEFA